MKCDVNQVLREHNWQFKPCPFCGSTDIGVKDNIIDLLMGNDCPSSTRRKIWAYCRYCGATSGTKIADIVYDDEEIAVAIEKWNERKGE
jgi:translation initiation factor 2 beta subunit (eIF-2beta)/eIF-5